MKNKIRMCVSVCQRERERENKGASVYSLDVTAEREERLERELMSKRASEQEKDGDKEPSER